MSKPQFYYTIRNAPLRWFASTMIGLVRILPERGAFALGRLLGNLAWWLHPRWRKTSSRNLELFFGDEYTPQERLKIGHQSAINLAYYAMEFVRMGFMPVEQVKAMVVEEEGMEYFEEALKDGGSAIGLAMHYGNWEMCGAYLVMKGFDLHAVGKEQRDDMFTRIAFPRRARFGIKNIFAGNKVNSAILRALRENAILGLLSDQNGGKNGTFAPFAGTMASTVAGPAALALKTGAPLVLTYCRRLAPGRFKMYGRKPVDVTGLPDDRQAAIVELLTRINKVYEDVIREDPTQWLWGHKRWKTRPAGEDPLY